MDPVIESVGEFGRYQFKILFVVGLISALSSACIYGTIFVAAEPDLICVINKTNGSRSFFNENLLSTTTISQNDNQANDNDVCNIYSNLNSTEYRNYTCYFDKTYYDKTIINEWNLVCDRQYLAGLTQTIHIFGSLFGFCGGVLGDKHGRRLSVIIFSLLLALSLIVPQIFLSNVPNLSIEVKYIIYSISQFLVGLLVNCVYGSAYVLLTELTTEKYITSLTNLNSYIYLIGELIVLVVYYISRNWHVLNWFIALYSFVLLLLAFTLPESPAWLIEMNRFDEAIKVLNDMAKFNGKKNYHLPIDLIENMKQQEKLINSNINNSDECNETNPIHEISGSIKQDNSESCNLDVFMLKDIFVPMENFIKLCLLFYIWIALMLLYYGISLGVTSIDLVDPYLMYFLSTIAEFIGYVCCYLNDLFGRKKTLSGFLFTTTVMYALIAYLSNDISGETSSFSVKAISLMVFALIGKCAVSGAYNISYIYTSELYPIKTRNTAVLFLTCFGGVSSLVAPQINLLKTLVWNPLPYIIYSVCALLGCGCVYFLKETKVHY